MFFKKGLISGSELIGALIVKDATSVPRKLSASAALKMSNVSYIESLIVSKVLGKEMPTLRSDIIDHESTLFKNNV
jgi:hypothetical protein